jgi:hypothetical protein
MDHRDIERLSYSDMQRGSRVPNMRTHVIEVLQDVRAGRVIMTYKTCEQAATEHQQCCVGPVDHSHDTATVQADPTARHHVVHGCDVAGRWDRTYARLLKISLATFSQ